MSSTTRCRVGRILTSTAALIPAVGAITADWNATHVHNPQWPPHAKFHNAQTITLAWLAAGLSLWQTWGPGPATRHRADQATVYALLFWLTQIPAPFFPGSALADPDTPIQPSVRWGVPVNQVTVTGAVVVPLLAAGRALQHPHPRRAA